jgi:hypothetical protein
VWPENHGKKKCGKKITTEKLLQKNYSIKSVAGKSRQEKCYRKIVVGKVWQEKCGRKTATTKRYKKKNVWFSYEYC